MSRPAKAQSNAPRGPVSPVQGGSGGLVSPVQGGSGGLVSPVQGGSGGLISRALAVSLAAVLLGAGCFGPSERPSGPVQPGRVVVDAAGRSVAASDLGRLVTVGAAVTETVFALGAGAAVVGVDSSSLYPAEAGLRPQVGYQRQLSAEAILSLSPTLVLLDGHAGPESAVQQLEASRVPILRLGGEPNLETAKARIHMLGTALGREREARALVAELDRSLTEQRRVRALGDRPPPKVLFIYARGVGAAQVAGRATAADEMIRLAGGQNVAHDFSGYRPLTAEAVLELAPEILLLTTRGASSLGGEAGIAALPGLALTPAVKNRRLVVLDDIELLSFGPRTGQALQALAEQLLGFQSAAADEAAASGGG